MRFFKIESAAPKRKNISRVQRDNRRQSGLERSRKNAKQEPIYIYLANSVQAPGSLDTMLYLPLFDDS
jgi:hypothetical protein